VDLDRYLATHKPVWDRLAALTRGGRRSIRKLDAGRIDELTQLYEMTATNLSHVRTHYRDPALVAYLTKLVSTAGATVYGTKPRTWRRAGRFFTITFPAAVWQARWFVAVSAALFVIPALVAGEWLAHSTSARDALLSDAARDAYVNHDFESYYESENASQFASHVFTNNALVGFQAFAFGVFLCIPTVLVLVSNGLNLGVAMGLFASYGQQGKFWGLIAPHGMLEITAVVIAGAAGLQLGWALVSPGERTRSEALTEAGRRAVVIVLGLVLAFAVAGTIEGGVTGQPWPTWLRVGIGLVAWTSFVTYVVVLGRRAAAAGFTGKLGEDEPLGWTVQREHL
jgi:uncharacterized membrane protein SpoIIM required for sporulation